MQWWSRLVALSLSLFACFSRSLLLLCVCIYNIYVYTCAIHLSRWQLVCKGRAGIAEHYLGCIQGFARDAPSEICRNFHGWYSSNEPTEVQDEQPVRITILLTRWALPALQMHTGAFRHRSESASSRLVANQPSNNIEMLSRKQKPQTENFRTPPAPPPRALKWAKKAEVMWIALVRLPAPRDPDIVP